MAQARQKISAQKGKKAGSSKQMDSVNLFIQTNLQWAGVQYTIDTVVSELTAHS